MILTDFFNSLQHIAEIIQAFLYIARQDDKNLAQYKSHFDFFSSLSTRSAASLPVKMEIGSPDGLYVHWPAWTTLGIGVRVELKILGNLLSAGMG